MHIPFIAIALLLTFNTQVQAEEIHLTADEKVEWYRAEQKMIATGNAVATKQDMNVRADKMTAFYEQNGNQKGTSIKNVHAEGHVIMTSPSAKAYGDTLDYDLIKDEMILRGSPTSKIITNDNKTITATDNITYYPSQNKAIALGDVIAQDDESTIYSNKMISYFTKNAQGQSELKKVEIYSDKKQVKIINEQATATGEWGVYLPQSNKVRLYKNVIINQDGNILHGDYAETDLKTGISRVLSNPKTGKRVSGIFIEKEKQDKKGKPQSSASQSKTTKQSSSSVPKEEATTPKQNWDLKE